MTRRHQSVTLLYVPADRPDRVKKALLSDADTVIVDLEDAVAPARKTAARDQLSQLLSGTGTRSVQVRVNALSSPWGMPDLEAVAGIPGVEVRLPKVESVHQVAQVVGVLGDRRPLHCLVETALGLECAFRIATSVDSIRSLSLGESDLRSELGAQDDRVLDWARSRVLVASRAAGLPPPSQSVFTDLRDLAGLRATSQAGRRMGFFGRCAIHPKQLAVIRDAYRPEPEEVERAKAVLLAIAEATDAGDGVLTIDGRFFDKAMCRSAERIVALAAATN